MASIESAAHEKQPAVGERQEGKERERTMEYRSQRGGVLVARVSFRSVDASTLSAWHQRLKGLVHAILQAGDTRREGALLAFKVQAQLSERLRWRQSDRIVGGPRRCQ